MEIGSVSIVILYLKEMFSSVTKEKLESTYEQIAKKLHTILFTPIFNNTSKKKTDKKTMTVFLIYTIISGLFAFFFKNSLFFFIFFILAITSYLGRLLSLFL